MTKKIFTTVVFLFLAAICRAQSTPAELLAQKIATKMSDSLQLGGGQKQQIYEVNLQLHQQKTALRTQYADVAVLGAEVQKVENTRDSLYKGVLSEEQYRLYRQKKTSLINNN